MIAPSFYFIPAKALYAAAICLLGMWALRSAAAGGRRWQQLFNLHGRDATIDWKVPFSDARDSTLTAKHKESDKDRWSADTHNPEANNK